MTMTVAAGAPVVWELDGRLAAVCDGCGASLVCDAPDDDAVAALALAHPADRRHSAGVPPPGWRRTLSWPGALSQ